MNASAGLHPFSRSTNCWIGSWHLTGYSTRRRAGRRTIIGHGWPHIRSACWAAVSHCCARNSRRTAVRLGHRREPPDGLLRVLVSMGGVDAGNATALAVRGLDIAARRIPTAGTIVVGDAYPHREALESLIDSVDVPIELVTRCNHMAALMAEHDVAIGAAGTSAWERCATGLPALNLVLAANQQGIAEQIETAGAAVNLGSGRVCQCGTNRRPAVALHDDPASYSRMVRAAFALVDGHGCQRTLDTVLTGA